MGELVTALLDKLKALSNLQTVLIWNNQFDYIQEGASYTFSMPSCFVEVVPEMFGDLGSGNQGVDLDINIHLGMDFYNGANIDDNTNIFDLRDLLVKHLYGFKPTEGGVMIKVKEEQDFNHSNVYHYIVSYKIHYIDSTTKREEFYTVAPTQLNITT